ncbi:MAG: type transport system permease protein [Chloroflexota bacterium]|nr:type transport system permease protein [Chloroflexota bacterium]MEA2605864.1 type transport system permease protein [Chloroflexota bacterium]
MNPFKPLTRILAIVGKELVSILRRPGALLSLVFGPFLIMALFGAGYSGFRRPLDTIVVLPADAGLPMDAKTYQDVAGEGLRITLVTSDEAAAMDQLNHQVVDVVVVAPSDLQATFEAGHRSQIQVRVNATDPVASSYDTFLARGLEAAVNRQIIEQAVTQGEGYAASTGAGGVIKIPPDVVAAPTQASLTNVAQSQPTVVQYFAPAVLALILQHLAVTLIALSVVRERTTGLFELFRISPITTAELVTGKLVAYGLFAGAVAMATIALLVVGFHVPILAQPGWIALIAGLLIASSLGLGLLIAAVSDSEPQTVQLSLLVLLASVFFSGFVLAISEFSEPIRSLIYILPVANAIGLFGDFMFRGGTVAVWQIWLLVGLSVAYIGGAWLLLRRVVARA